MKWYVLVFLLIFALGQSAAYKVFTPSKGLTGQNALLIAGSRHAVWAYTYYQVPIGTGYEVIGGVSEYRSMGNWSTYTDQDGLASDLVNDIAIDGGDVWFATSGGVSLFDESKHSWRTFSEGEGLPSNEVLSIGVGPDKVWFGTTRGVCAFDKESGNLTSYGEDDGLIFRYVVDVAVDGDTVYFATSKGVGVFNSQTGKWSQITTQNGLPTNAVNSVMVTMGYIWFGTESGVSCFSKSTGEWKHYQKADGLSLAGARCAAAGRSSVWFVTQDGIARFKPSKGKWKIFSKKLPGQANDVALGMGYVWIATSKGIVRMGVSIPPAYLFTLILGVVLASAAVIRLRPVLKEKAEKAKGKGGKRPAEPPPWERCGGTPSRMLCPVCKYNTLKGGEPYCTKYRKKIVYETAENSRH